MTDPADIDLPTSWRTLLRRVPPSVGKWSSLHVLGDTEAREWAPLLSSNAPLAIHRHRCSMVPTDDPNDEGAWIHERGLELLRAGANRRALIVWLGDAQGTIDRFAPFVGTLPYRGLAVALLRHPKAPLMDNAYRFVTPSGVWVFDLRNASRLGQPLVVAILGAHIAAHESPVNIRCQDWTPIDPPEAVEVLPFEINGLRVPMCVDGGLFDGFVLRVAQRFATHYASRRTSVAIFAGATCTALGYATAVQLALRAALPDASIVVLTHASGESHKRWDTYATPQFTSMVRAARSEGRALVLVAVGGGVNGNGTGVMASLTNADFVQLPTTPMHFNDATTSAKQAFNWVDQGSVVAKNIIGCFYMPLLVIYSLATVWTLTPASIEAAVGEAAKTMAMLGVATSASGRREYREVGGAAHATDTTTLVRTALGYERLVAWLRAHAEAQRGVLEAPTPGERDTQRRALEADAATLDDESRRAIDAFQRRLHRMIISSKAMFLAHDDPFEKRRALLFEYGHTLGHAVEAWANDLNTRALLRPELEALRVAARRYHGQYVGMAVMWAGALAEQRGHLTGDGLRVHQGFVGLFNRTGGFDIAPIRALSEALGDDKGAFERAVLRRVRHDNKRGYVPGTVGSVDQLVDGRPGRMVRSGAYSEARLRYLVEVDEEEHRAVLARAWHGEFDRALDLSADGALSLVPRSDLTHSIEVVANALYAAMHALLPSSPTQNPSVQR